MPVVDAMNLNMSAITLHADGIRLEGFVCTNAGAMEAGVLVYSNHNTIVGNTAFGNSKGIYLLGSENNTVSSNNASFNEEEGMRITSASNGNVVTGNVLSHNGVGLSVAASQNNTISENDISYNDMDGMRIASDSTGNMVRENVMSHNGEDGLSVLTSQANTIIGNTLSQNEYGISLFKSYNNTIYHNDLVDNSRDAWDFGGANQWDDGSRGNYYSALECLDSDGDGVCDQPYKISENSSDRYPLTLPSTPQDDSSKN